MSGSGLFSNKRPLKPHLLQQSGGIAAEVNDLRVDVDAVLTPLAAITVEELTNLAADDTTGLKAATAVTVSPQTITSFVAGGVAVLAAHPRSIKFTTAGGTPSDAPASCVVTGRDINGAVLPETVTLAQTGTSVETVKCYSSLTSVAYAAADGTDATIAIGIGIKAGLLKKLKARAGTSGLIREIVAGVIATTPTDVAVQEWTNPIASDADGLLVATATTVGVQTYLEAALISGGKTALATYPRNVTFTTAGGTPSDAPANAVVTGTDIDGNALVETITVAQAATISEGAKAFKTITSIVYAAGDGTDATVSIGFGKKFGLYRAVKFRAGTTKPLQEIEAGTVVTTGTMVDGTTSPPYGSYSPSTNPDGANDYAVYFESLATAGSTIVAAATSTPNGSYAPSVAFNGTRDYTLYYEYDATV